MEDNSHTSRRDFLTQSAKVAAIAGLVSRQGFSAEKCEHEKLEVVAGPTPKPIRPDQTIGLGIVGAGVRTGSLLGHILGQKNMVIKAVADPHEGNRNGLLNKLKKANIPTPDVYTGSEDYRDKLLARDDIQVVFLATPCYTHGKMYLDCFAAGKHFYGEKPMCIRVDEANALVEAQKKNPKVIAQIGFQRRASERYNKGIQAIRDGAIGKPLAGRAQWAMGRTYGLPSQGTRVWMGRARLSGDWMLEQACHTWDVLCWVAGEKTPVAISGMGNREVFKHMDPERDVTDYYIANLEFPDGLLVNYEHIWFVPPRDERRWSGVYERFAGLDGGIALDEGKIFPRNKKKKPVDLGGPSGGGQNAESMKAFFNCLRSGTKPPSGVENGRRATLTGLLVRKAVYEKRRVTMKELLG
ncbi:MAG: Gfo/Idh/MocA family oxidoreductase [Planctomycetota bacterium]|nr:MAG: Gfo/Idh/MocA family oxidoreductase [Planctomycetota bacterium]